MSQFSLMPVLLLKMNGNIDTLILSEGTEYAEGNSY